MTELKFKPDRYILESEREGSSLFGTGVRKFFTIAVISVVGLFVAMFLCLSVMVSILRLHAFRVPSVSMCPTVCLNENLFASMDAYGARPPARGEVIMLKHKDITGLVIKRVVGIEGDVVSHGHGQGNAVLINGTPLARPKTCGKPDFGDVGDSRELDFATVQVPKGFLFVVGDNLGNSFDSRLPQFGLVSIDQAKAKPLFVYWSPSISRIGCALE